MVSLLQLFPCSQNPVSKKYPSHFKKQQKSIKCNELLTNGPPDGGRLTADSAPQGNNGQLLTTKNGVSSNLEIRSAQARYHDNGPPSKGVVVPDAFPVGASYPAEQPFDDVSHPYKDLVNYFWNFVQKDKPYQALAGYCGLYSKERKWILEALVARCYQQYKVGFKDTDTLMKYIFEVEDGRNVNLVEIKDTDIVHTKPPPKSPDVHEVDGPMPSVRESKQNKLTTDGPPSRNRPSPENKVMTDSVASSTESSEQSQGAWKKSEFTCKVCLDQLVSVTFVPCGHLVACVSCASALFECPVCRASIRGTIKTFF